MSRTHLVSCYSTQIHSNCLVLFYQANYNPTTNAQERKDSCSKLLTKHQPILSHFYVLCIHLYSFQFHFSPHSLSQLHHHTTVSWLWFSSFISSSRTSDLIRQRRFSQSSQIVHEMGSRNSSILKPQRIYYFLLLWHLFYLHAEYMLLSLSRAYQKKLAYEEVNKIFKCFRAKKKHFAVNKGSE